MKRWTSDELRILEQHYVDHGTSYCSDILQRSARAIGTKANELGLLSQIVNGGSTKKQVVNKLPNGRVIALCRSCGQSPHYVRQGKIQHCVQCKLTNDRRRSKTNEGRRMNREKSTRYRNTLLGKYADRLRSSLNQCVSKMTSNKPNTIGCFRHLQYSPQQLYDHLESIRIAQNNICPSCVKSYDVVLASIDHIIPLATAKTTEQILRLFNLPNLSLLCQPCNSSKGSNLCL